MNEVVQSVANIVAHICPCRGTSESTDCCRCFHPNRKPGQKLLDTPQGILWYCHNWGTCRPRCGSQPSFLHHTPSSCWGGILHSSTPLHRDIEHLLARNRQFQTQAVQQDILHIHPHRLV